MKSSDKNAFGYLDALKGPAILAVTMVHTGAGKLPGFFGKIGNDGARGVQMFFVISGILAFCSLKRAFPDGKPTFTGVLKWYLKKYLRIAPLYYFAVLISMFTGSWSTHWLGSEGVVSFKNILAHVFLAHGLFPHYTDSILGVEWYLGVLWIFYLITPILFKVVSSLEKAVIFIVAVFIVNPFCNMGLAYILPAGPDPYIYKEYLENFGPFSQFLVYSFGILLYFVIVKLRDKQIKHKKVLAYALLIFATILVFGQVAGAGNPVWFSRNEMFGLFFAIIIFSQAIYPSVLIDNPVFKFIGRYSYGIYLFQFIWLHFYEKYICYTGRFAWAVKFAVSVLAMLAISFLLTEFLEKPIHKKLLKLTSGGRVKDE